MLRIAFAGTPQFALPTLQALAASSHRLIGVLTQPDRPAGRGRRIQPSPVKQLALQLALPLLQPLRLTEEREVLAQLTSWKPDLLVVVAYGLLLPPALLQLPRLGCVNVHASLLPRWRGAAPIQHAILAGDTETGITLMRMEAGLDTGPIIVIGEPKYTQSRTPTRWSVTPLPKFRDMVGDPKEPSPLRWLRSEDSPKPRSIINWRTPPLRPKAGGHDRVDRQRNIA